MNKYVIILLAFFFSLDCSICGIASSGNITSILRYRGFLIYMFCYMEREKDAGVIPM